MGLIGDREEDVRLLLTGAVLTLDPQAVIRQVDVDAAREMATGFSGNVPSMLATVMDMTDEGDFGGCGHDYLESARMLQTLSDLTPPGIWARRTHPSTFPEMKRKLEGNLAARRAALPERPIFLGSARAEGLCSVGQFGAGIESTHIIKSPDSIFHTSFWVDRVTGLPPRPFMEWCVACEHRNAAHEMEGGPWAGRTIEEGEFLSLSLRHGRAFGLYKGHRACRTAYTLSSFLWKWEPENAPLLGYC